jgi:predicted RNase H-like HicB family nuclease
MANSDSAFGIAASAPAYTAVVKQDGPWWIGWIEELPGVNCQEATREALLESLREALRDMLQMNRDDARAAAGSDYAEVPISP